MQRIVTLPPLPARLHDGHKGTFGRVLVVGGSDGMIGAPVLAGTAALRMGTGLLQIAVPTTILSAALTITPELIGIGLGKSISGLVGAADQADAIVVGPGMGQSSQAQVRLMRLIRLNKPMVIDADGLNLLASQKRWPASMKAKAVLTPHPGEMKRLGKLVKLTEVPTDERGRIDVAGAAAAAFRQVVVFKGHRTVVTDGSKVYVNRTGDSTLAKAGSGDILSGMIGTLLAQGVDRFDAACAAVHIHGRMGELAGKQFGVRCALARDMIQQLPAAISEYLSEWGESSR